MKRQLPEVAAGWEWIQTHQDEFEKEVFGPPMISCSMKDERYSDLVQSLLQRDDFTCFTVQTRDDYLKLSDQLYKQMSLSVSIRTCDKPLSMYRPPVDAATARQLGLDGFAIDFVEGPEPVLAMLCGEKKLHMSGVALREHNDEQYERIISGGKVNSWAAGRQSYMIRRRAELGPQAMLAVTKNIQQGQFWTSQPVDTSEKAEMERKLLELRHEFAELKDQYKATNAKVDAILEQKKEIGDEIVSISPLKVERPGTDKWTGPPPLRERCTAKGSAEVARVACEDR